PQIRLVPFGPVAVSFTPFATCHSSMHPPAIVNVTGVANGGLITFTDFGGAVQPNQANTPPDARVPIDRDFQVNYGGHLQANFQFDVQDARRASDTAQHIQTPA